VSTVITRSVETSFADLNFFVEVSTSLVVRFLFAIFDSIDEFTVVETNFRLTYFIDE